MKLSDLKILVTGANGQVGFEIAKSLSSLTKNLYISTRKKDSQSAIFSSHFVEMDLDREEQIRTTLNTIQPHIIISAAAYTQVDKAEDEKDKAFQINHRAVEIFAEYLKATQGALIHFSTDYVFNASHNLVMAEDEAKKPGNVYGLSKLAGENAIRESGIPHIIFRTSWVYGTNGNNFVKTMLKLGKDREQLSIISDQIGSPTSATTLAMAVSAVLLQGSEDPLRFLAKNSGDYNISDSGHISWYDFAVEIFRVARQLNYEGSCTSLRPIPSEAYPTKAERPRNSRMSLKKLEKTFGITPPAWDFNLGLFLWQIQKEIK